MPQFVAFVADLQALVQIRSRDLSRLGAHRHNRGQALLRKKVASCGSQDHGKRYDDRKCPHNAFEHFLLPMERLQDHQGEFPTAHGKPANYAAISVLSSGHVYKCMRPLSRGAHHSLKRFRAEYLSRELPSNLRRGILRGDHDCPIRIENCEGIVTKSMLRNCFSRSL